MEPRHPSFSTSTLTMKDTRSRPYFGSDRRSSRGPGMRQPPEAGGRTRRRSSNLSDLYKNPQIYAGLKQSGSDTLWSISKKCLLLTPAFSIQFCTVFASVFSTVNIELLGASLALSSLHLLLAGALSIVLVVAFQKYVCKFYGEKRWNAQVFMGFMIYLCVGVLMVLAANVERIFNAEVVTPNVTDMVTVGTTLVNPRTLSDANMQSSAVSVSNRRYKSSDVPEHFEVSISNSISPSTVMGADLIDGASNITTTSSQYVVSSTLAPLYTKIMAFLGYVIVASSLSSGHYLLLSISMSMTHTDDYDSLITFTTAAAAIGGCAVSFLGGIDLSSGWYPSLESRYHVYGQVCIIACITIVLLVGTTICSICTWNVDAITRKFRPSRDSDVDRWAAKDRRPTRTAQEIFDECAPLLGHSNPTDPHIEEESSLANPPLDPDVALSYTMSQSGTAVEEDSVFSSRPDLVLPYSLPTTVSPQRKSWLAIVKTQKRFAQAALLVFFLSSSWVSLEYNSSLYLAYAAYEGQDEDGHSFSKGTRVGSAGIFMIYLIFTAVYFFYDRVPQQAGWKQLGLGMSLVASLLTLILALTDKVPVYFVVTCVHGLLRVVVMSLPHLLTAQTARTQSGFQTTTVKQILIECPTTIIWCLTPLSLVVSSAITSPLTEVTGIYGVPVYYSAVTAILGFVTLIILTVLN